MSVISQNLSNKSDFGCVPLNKEICCIKQEICSVKLRHSAACFFHHAANVLAGRKGQMVFAWEKKKRELRDGKVGKLKWFLLLGAETEGLPSSL